MIRITRDAAYAIFSETLDTVTSLATAVAAARVIGQRASEVIEREEAVAAVLGRAPFMEGEELKEAEKAARRAYEKGTHHRATSLISSLSKLEQAMEYESRKDFKRRERQMARELVEEERGDLPPLSSQILGWDGLLAQPKPKWAVDLVIPQLGTVIVYGASGIGKSFVCQSLAASIAGGFDWLGRPVEAGPTLYIFGEGAAGAGKRFAAQADAWNGGEPIEALRVLPVAPNLTSETDIAELELLNREHDFAAIVYDTLNRVAGDAEENSATAMSGILNAIERIRRAGTRTTSIIVTHSGKNGDLRGSTALWAAADTVLELTGEASHLKLEARKQKDAPEGVVGFFRLVKVERHETLILEGVAPGQGQPSGIQAGRIEEALAHFVTAFGQTGVTRSEYVSSLIEWLSVSKSSAQSYVGELISSGRLSPSVKGRSTWLELSKTVTFPTNTEPKD